MAKVTVDGIEVEVPNGSSVLQACEAAGKEIPRFCYARIRSRTAWWCTQIRPWYAMAVAA
jgi:NADH dehydrogenase/NADH:ubiquinone oxidoreductase subunit G